MKSRQTYDKDLNLLLLSQCQLKAQLHNHPVMKHQHMVSIMNMLALHNIVGSIAQHLTAISNLRPCRSLWAAGGDHPIQEQLVNYVLDKARPANEIIVKDGPTCLTRENLLSLGLNREMDSMMGLLRKSSLLGHGKNSQAWMLRGYLYNILGLTVEFSWLW
ncbi:hypothetical protein Q8A67_018941 [Cirrhinus molitorella]|uniref:Uncharacterized protein n=1 Tax=Cirrhinus molitorella TaxID=172907 RepID=A0AA88PPJ4_9TELE|nr:hypothetical protein Q8A67_018941 [Cirrhinus molitorella]